MTCSHCWRKGHNKRRCPDRDRPHEELKQEWGREQSAYYETANRVADILGAFPPEERVRLAIEAFDRSSYRYQLPVARELMCRESAAKDVFRGSVTGNGLRLIKGGATKGGR